jgi:hypothetical protein
MKALSTIEELAFEPRDVAIFSIPDMRTRLNTVQNYFFPRLELLLRDTVGLIQDIYGVNPYEMMTTAYTPSNRKDAKQLLSFDCALVGMTGKRRTDRYLHIIRDDGSAYYYHPSYLSFIVENSGAMYVDFQPYRYHVGKAFLRTVNEVFQEHFSTLEPLLLLNGIIHNSASAFVSYRDAFEPEAVDRYNIRLRSQVYYLPIDIERGLLNLQMAFVALYPLLDSMICLGEGTTPRLGEMVEQFKERWFDAQEHSGDEEELQDDGSLFPVNLNLPELDSYYTTRTGLWWMILARDGWRCLSCGRTPSEHGVTLEVDHILPRSHGGTDDPENLQTLCKKCNIGKSNRDATDLRSVLQ